MMDINSLPLLQIILVVLILVGTILGYRSGKKREFDVQNRLIKDKDDSHLEAIDKLTTDYEDKLKVLNKANLNEINKINQNHQLQISQLNEQHQKTLQSIENGYLKETEQLNDKHAELIQQLTQDNTQKIQDIQKEHELHTTKVIERSEQISQSMQNKFDEELLAIQKHNETLKQNLDQANKALFDIRHKMEQDKQNSMHSLSKSGDKLIRVVRSVQELANELDETSRTVTGGEYSFFEEIQDQRDREAVLSLTQTKSNQSLKNTENENSSEKDHQNDAVEETES